jgi:AMMECR1 domain-containing protein
MDIVTIEISILSLPILAAAENVVPGLHGVAISKDGARGVLLPHVAREAGWDRETLLAEACKKAGLPADAWMQTGLTLRVFWAYSFEESR